jgi:ABC-type multidrug transport system fused ATPase/permease subunit
MAARERKLTTRELLTWLPRALALVWQADRVNALAQAALTLVQAALPAAMAWVGKLIIDTVVTASTAPSDALEAQVMRYVAWELGLALLVLLTSRLSSLSRELLRARLGNLLNERLLEKALTLELKHFEDSKTYDVMQNARREAASRPLSLAMASITVVRQLLTLSSFAVLLWSISWWSTLLLLAAALPAFFAETKLSGEAFKLYSWRAPEGRRLNYLEWILTRDSTVKEVKLFGLGPLVLGRYRALFAKFLGEDRRLALKRFGWGVGLGAVSLAAFYVCFVVVAGRAARGLVSVGDLTLSIALFRQGQSAFEAVLGAIAGMYEDALFLSNLDAFFALPTSGEKPRGAPVPLPKGPLSLELDHVSYRYPNKADLALDDVTLTLAPGEKLALVGENGAGKSTLIRLLLRLDDPTSGAIRLGGVDLRDVDVSELRARIGAVFQDFVRYQFTAAENVGLGDPARVEERPAIVRAADAGGAKDVIEALPQQYDTTLGGWFEKGHELSGGQWQKLAVSRAFMREGAELLVLDEPTAAIDAAAEVALFERFRALAASRTAIIISHRFSTVRMADRIAVLEKGRLLEQGTHDELLAAKGRYAELFTLQARGYR